VTACHLHLHFLATLLPSGIFRLKFCVHLSRITDFSPSSSNCNLRHTIILGEAYKWRTYSLCSFNAFLLRRPTGSRHCMQYIYKMRDQVPNPHLNTHTATVFTSHITLIGTTQSVTGRIFLQISHPINSGINTQGDFRGHSTGKRRA
jgi:hypothetical protein